MSIRNFEVTNLGDYNTQKMQDSSALFLRQIEKFPMFSGNLLKDIALTNSAQDISHKLNRNPQGYLITKRSAGQTVYNSTMNDKTIRLTATANVTVDIWIY